MSPDACKWRDILLSASYPARDKKRVNAIARVLAGNKFRRLEHLARAPPVSQWLYTHRLVEDEHVELQAFCDALTDLPAAVGRMPRAATEPAAAAAEPVGEQADAALALAERPKASASRLKGERQRTAALGCTRPG